jgi:hypothetical protein
MHTLINIRMYKKIHTCIQPNTYLCIHIYILDYPSRHKWKYILMNIHLYLYIYICKYEHVHLYIYVIHVSLHLYS